LKLASHAIEYLYTGIGSIKSTAKTMSPLVFKVAVCKSLTSSLYAYHVFSILATSPVHPIAGNTHDHNFCVQNSNFSCRGNTSFDHTY